MFRFIKNAHKDCSFIRNFGKKFSSEQEASAAVKNTSADNTEFSMTPKNIVEYLNSFIIGQQDAKRSMAIALSTQKI